MKILVVEPDKEPVTKEIENELHDMQKVVGGLIEPIYFEPQNDALVFCNEEFLLNDSQPNRMVGDILVHGTFFVVGNTTNEYGEDVCCSLTDEQLEKYSQMFAEPIQTMDFDEDIAIIIM